MNRLIQSSFREIRPATSHDKPSTGQLLSYSRKIKETSARLLRVLAFLQIRTWSSQDLAERLGVTTRTVRRDIEKLRKLEYPVEAARGSGGGYRLGLGAQLPPLVLDDDEAVAVAITLRTAAASGVTGLGETALRALIKLEQVLPRRLQKRVKALPLSMVHGPGRAATVDADLLTTVGVACRERLHLRFDYEAHQGSPSRHLVEPHELVAWGSRWYLVAWDANRRHWTAYWLDRVRLHGGPIGPRFVPREIARSDVVSQVARTVAQMWSDQATIRMVALGKQIPT
jgi:predicted DNA-binding transcriptional regulator YafY